MQIDKDSTDVDRVDPVIQVANNSPKTLHDQFHVLAVGIITSHGVVKQPQQSTEIFQLD